MRTGQNPAKSINNVTQPEKVTIAVITYIPFLEGYYAESLDVLKVCLNSILENTQTPFDLFIFDNASCEEVQEFLIELRRNGDIQYLTLSEKNIGKAGAWNYIFGAAPGEYIAYCDGDIYHHPGWLSALIEILETFHNVGMITGIPMWSPEEFSTSTITWAKNNPEVKLDKGPILPWEDYWRHASSLGHPEEKARAHFDNCEEYVLEYRGVRCYIGAGHFQFLARRHAIQSILPLSAERPMGQVRQLDSALNDKGYKRLSTENWWVQHMGNSIPEVQNLIREDNSMKSGPISNRVSKRGQINISASWFWNLRPVRRILQWTNGKTFDLLYRL